MNDDDARTLRQQAVDNLLSRRDASASSRDAELEELKIYHEELRMQEEALRETNARLVRELERSRILFEDAPTPYLVLDQGARVVDVNHAALRELVVDRDDVLGRSLVHFVEPASAPELVGTMRAALMSHEPQRCEVRAPGRSGDTRIWELHLKAIHALENAEMRCLVGVSNLTQVRRAQEELKSARLEAERSAHLRGRFVANLSHEVRTPITLILGYVDTLLEMDFDAEVLRRLRVVRRAGDGLLTVLNDVVDFARIEANRLQIASDPFDPRDAVEQVSRLFELAARKRDITLTREHRGLPRWLLGDASRLGQVLTNLLSNALKHTPAGGRVEVATAYRSGNLVVSVSDSGPGVPEDIQELIFEPFRQAEGPDAERHGAGLGLAISRQVMNLMRGELYVRNLADGGARFTMQLPLPRAPAPPPAALARLKSVPSSCTILIVDDDESVRTLMGVIVDALGCAYDEARNGAEALERMRSREYAVVLMDIQMPVLGGIAALRQIRQTPGLDRAYVVALTACALQDERAEIFAAGFDACLMKPIDLAELRALIRGRVGDQPAPDPDPA